MTRNLAVVKADETSTGEGPILRIAGLGKTFERRSVADHLRRRASLRTVALDDVSLTVHRGETLGIVGESGSGKTTLARAIVRLVEPDTGTVEFAGEDVRRLRGRELAAMRRKVQLVYQDPYSSLNPAISIGKAIAEPALVHGLVARGHADERVAELLSRVGLASALVDRRPRELSGGQRQRVAIARALAAEPEILITDEAVSALDVSIQAQVLALLQELQDQLNLTLLFVSHQLATVAQLCQRVAIMYRGRIVELGPVAEVFETPRHGYTVSLLRAHPGQRRIRDRSSAEPVTTVAQPSAYEEEGCSFRHRCLFRESQCQDVTPPDANIDETHRARCLVLPNMKRNEIHARAGLAHEKPAHEAKA